MNWIVRIDISSADNNSNYQIFQRIKKSYRPWFIKWDVTIRKEGFFEWYKRINATKLSLYVNDLTGLIFHRIEKIPNE